MSDEIKSGKEVLDEFFNSIKDDTDLDQETVAELVALYEQNKLTDKNSSNALAELRETTTEND
jgi:hypothetical protein